MPARVTGTVVAPVPLLVTAMAPLPENVTPPEKFVAPAVLPFVTVRALVASCAKARLPLMVRTEAPPLPVFTNVCGPLALIWPLMMKAPVLPVLDVNVLLPLAVTVPARVTPSVVLLVTVRPAPLATEIAPAKVPGVLEAWLIVELALIVKLCVKVRAAERLNVPPLRTMDVPLPSSAAVPTPSVLPLLIVKAPVNVLAVANFVVPVPDSVTPMLPVRNAVKVVPPVP